MSKLFNKIDQGTTKLFSKASKDIKMFGKLGGKVGTTVGGALGSAGGEVAKVASEIEKGTRGTALGAIAGRVAKGASAVQTGGKAIKALSKGDVEDATKLGRKTAGGIMRVV